MLRKNLVQPVESEKNRDVACNNHNGMHRYSLVLATAAIVTLISGAPLTAKADTSAPSMPGAQLPSQPPTSSQPQSTWPRGRELTRADLETWLDGLVPYAISNGNIAGGVVVVVKDGAVLLQKGYGYADVENKTPVDPERTLFRVGSVSKIFTWTAVMQQIEQGKIELDRDINDYLDFKIPPAFDQPITMRHLMTHTAGFEERIKNMAGASPEQFRSLETYVKASIPTRIYAPGAVPSYSNYGAALAGYIVQRTSGEDFVDYLDRHVFGPLGMQRSTFRQPLPESLSQDMARGYDTAADSPWYFEICNPSPAGSMSATGADIAQFMISHLRAESGGDTRLLRAEAARVLHRSVSRPIPTLNGISLGFETNRDVRRIIGHGGDTQIFHSDLKLYLDDGIGLFMAFNSDGNDGASWNILTSLYEQFTDRYSPVPLPEEATLTTAMEHGQQIAAAGPYLSSRRAESSFLWLLATLGPEQISVNDDGTIVLPSETGLNGQPKVWREVAPYVWREVGGTQRLGALVVDGQVRALGLDIYAGTQVLQPASIAHASTSAPTLMMWAAAALLLTVLHWPIAALVRRHHGARLSLAPREALARTLVRVGAIVGLVFLLGWMLVIKSGMGDISAFGDSLDPSLRALHLLGLLAVAGAGVACWNLWLSWPGTQGLWARLWNVAIAVAFVALVWFAFTFKLISPGLEY
jgi:CubicO group peptidase (beta-lactamase class C family)